MNRLNIQLWSNYDEMIERLQENDSFCQIDCEDDLSESKTTFDGYLERFESPVKSPTTLMALQLLGPFDWPDSVHREVYISDQQIIQT